jgi:aryl-alcohol dehydrogenase-like predicted oxidoreductase
MRSGRKLDPTDARVNVLQRIADQRHITLAQAVLAWELALSPIILPIPGTTRIEHLEEDIAAAKVHLTQHDVSDIG